MKKLIFLLLMGAFAFNAGFAQIHKAALISVFGSRNLSDNPVDTKLFMALMKDSSFNLAPIIDQFDELFRANFLPQFPFPFLSKEEVINIPGYQDIKKLTRWASENYYTTAAKGYVPIAAYGIADDEDAMKKAFELLPPDVDAIMIAYINFNLYDQVGLGSFSSKKVYAYVNIKIFDRKIERIFKLKERASSESGVAAIGGFVVEKEKIMPMIQSASDNLFEDMKDSLPKSLKKMARKLEK